MQSSSLTELHRRANESSHAEILKMPRYPWYTQVTDAVHRLTVLTLIGGSAWMMGSLGFTMYQNGKRYEQRVTQQQQNANEEQELEGAASSAE
ncbi:COX14 (YML129C) [Zygosaccharomyces parabailii]|nr:COX14 (YML129C) [Zygosaccharomyces parabailii]